MIKLLPVAAALASIGFLSSTPACADPIVTSFTPSATSVGGPYFVGYQFTANSNLAVSALGFYDGTQNGLNSSHTVGLFDSIGNLLGSVVVGPGSENLVGNFEYANLASSIGLVSGASYSIGATTSGSDAWVYQGTNLVTNGVTYNGSYFSPSGNLAPMTSSAADRQYFTVNGLTGAVPEPATWAMMLVGFGAIGFAMRRRSAPIAQLA